MPKLVNLDVSGWDLSEVTSMTSAFSGAPNLETVDVGGWDISKVTSTASLFSGLKKLKKAEVSGWNTSNLKNASYMFYDCDALTGEIDLSSWDTNKLEDISKMFQSSGVETLTLNGWNFSNVKNITYFADYCQNLKVINLEGATIKHRLGTKSGDLFYNTSNNPQITTINAKNCKIARSDIDNMFGYMPKLVNLDVSGWDLSEVTSMTRAFSGAPNLETVDVGGWDISKVTSTASLFSGLKKLKKAEVSGWDTSNLKNASFMFYDCDALTGEIDLSSWKTGQLEDISYMFQSSGVETLTLNGWNFSNVKNITYFADYCQNLKVINLEGATIKHRLGTKSGDLFSNTSNNPQITTINAKNCKIARSDIDNMFGYMPKLVNLDVSGWDLSEVTSMKSAFSGAPNLETVDIGGWDISKVTSTASLFSGLKKLKKAEVSGWNTSNLKNASYMFYHCDALTGEIDLSSWKTDQLEDISNMFQSSGVETLTLNGWNFSNVKNITYFADYCQNLKVINLEGATIKHRLGTKSGDLFYNTSNNPQITTINAKNCKIARSDIDNMFGYMPKLVNLDISGWDISKVTSASNMFSNCVALESVNLMGWNIPSTLDTSTMLSGCNRSFCTIICSAATKTKLMTDNPNLVVNWDIR